MRIIEDMCLIEDMHLIEDMRLTNSGYNHMQISKEDGRNVASLQGVLFGVLCTS